MDKDEEMKKYFSCDADVISPSTCCALQMLTAYELNLQDLCFNIVYIYLTSFSIQTRIYLRLVVQRWFKFIAKTFFILFS